MTDRVKGLIVTLEQDIRIDDVEPLMDAIRQLRGVGDVSPSITDSSDHINRMRVRSELQEKFLQFLKDVL